MSDKPKKPEINGNMDNKILKTELIEWQKLKPFQPEKLKRMTANQLKKLKESLKKNGFAAPFYVWETEGDLFCLDGHHRLPAMRLLQDEGVSIPKKLPANFIYCKNKTEAKKFILVFNSYYADIIQAELNDWIADLDLSELQDQIDIKGINFDAPVIVQDDDPPPAPENPKSKQGDIYLLGDHVVICGDSSNLNLLEKGLNGARPCLCFTDPPYGVSIGKKNVMLNSFQPSGRNLTDIESDDKSPSELKKILVPIMTNIKKVCSDDCTYFLTAPQGGELGMMMMMMMKESGLPIRHVLMWLKNSATFSMGRLDYDYQHEPILLTWGKKHKSIMKGPYKTSVWKVDKPRASKEHPTMKPVELYINALLNNSEEGDYAIDPFAGSGPMLIACEQTKRKAVCIELTECYTDVIVQRWVNFTGGDVLKNGKKCTDFRPEE